MDLFMFAIIGILLAIHVGFELLHYRREERLLNRIMAKDLREFEYYDKRYKTDLTELEKLRDEQREEREAIRAEEESIPSSEDKIKLSDFEDGWDEEESPE